MVVLAAVALAIALGWGTAKLRNSQAEILPTFETPRRLYP